jgi:cytidine deaminase
MPSPEELIAAAQRARARSYAPYSHFTVGAALETQSGEVIVGGNVENASYGVGLCAERSAIVRAVAEGHRAFRGIAIAGPEGTACAPCGACRQFLAEFAPTIPVYYTAPGGFVSTTMAELLPASFGPHSLEEAKQ